MRIWPVVLALLLCFSASAEPKRTTVTYRIDSLASLELLKVKAEPRVYKSRRALRLLDASGGNPTPAGAMAVVSGTDFEDGTIEVEVAGMPRHGTPDAGARGFIGIAFRIQPDNAHFECFYIRPTNGRAADQLRRNHSTQYESEPDFPWSRLRTESPGSYESYADLEAGAWTKIKVVVSGIQASLYVNGADRPCLIVNDLKLGKARGRIALWVGPETDGYFSKLIVRR
ncbi:MAG: hypothetical protein ABSB35_16860 [Bryobacteraceae bacterium]|jgi:hypothetical protein